MSAPATNKTYCVAWFKLAEFIERGEKERALGMYRLLTHTVPDPAFTYQLEGDLLAAFGDTAIAQERYLTAAQLYCAQKDFMHAVGLYETLVQRNRTNTTLLQLLAQTYARAATYERALHRTIILLQEPSTTNIDLLQQIIIHQALGDTAERYLVLGKHLIYAEQHTTPSLFLTTALPLLLQESPLATAVHERQQLLYAVQNCYPAVYEQLCTQLA